MARISKQDIDYIFDNIDIVSLVSEYVKLEKRGQNYLGLCPFHNEKTPSFTVSPEKKIAHCFGCGKGGNIFQFVSLIENITYNQAIAKLGTRLGLDLESNDNKEASYDLNNELDIMYYGHRLLADYYNYILLNTKEAEDALKYLLDRGLSEDVIKHFNLGYAPRDNNIALNFFNSNKINLDLMVEAGLLGKNDNGDYYDVFKDRVMFPIKNNQNQVVAFSGRTMSSDKSVPKYYNTHETKIFEKRTVLYNFSDARSFIAKENEVILCEGYMDVISAWQAGVQIGVASMGTSLTPDQIQTLQKVTDTILIAYDGDKAGLEATNRAIEMIQDTNAFKIGIIPFDNGLDPDEFIKERGAQAFKDLVEYSQETVYQFKKRFLSKKYPIQIESQKIQYIEEMIVELSKINNEVELNLAMKSLADEFDLDFSTILNQVKQLRLRLGKQKRQSNAESVSYNRQVEIKPATKNEHIQKQLMYRLLHNEQAWTYLNRIDSEFVFPDSHYEQLYLLLQSFKNEENEVDVQQFFLFLDDKDVLNRNLVSEIELSNFPPECTEQEIQDLVYVLSKKNSLKEQLASKKEELNRAALMKDDILRQKLMREIMEIQRQLRNKMNGGMVNDSSKK